MFLLFLLFSSGRLSQPWLRGTGERRGFPTHFWEKWGNSKITPMKGSMTHLKPLEKSFLTHGWPARGVGSAKAPTMSNFRAVFRPNSITACGTSTEYPLLSDVWVGYPPLSTQLIVPTFDRRSTHHLIEPFIGVIFE